MLFKELGLNDCVLDAIYPLGYEKPTPIQEQSIPIVLDGKDLLGCAQTGTGKTAAFSLPIVHHLSSTAPKSKGKSKPVRALIISPTRELTSQINDNLRDYCSQSRLKTAVIYGGVPQRRQTDALRRGVDILVATPGRLLDLCDQGFINLSTIEFLVLDEADTMLDMGFLPDIKKIIKKCSQDRQTLFFSATMPDNIVSLADNILTDPKRVQIKAVSSAADTVDQRVYYVRQGDKKDLLIDILSTDDVPNALVFTRTKFGADKVVRYLQNSNIRAEAIHGNKSQPAREKSLKKFKQGKINVLVATDIASRGIDVDDLSLVINFELPNIAESYVHRIGRTGRAGKSGIAISFCNEGEERNHLRGIQKLIGREIELIEDHPFHLPMEPVGMVPKPPGKKRKKPKKNQDLKSFDRSSRGDKNRDGDRKRGDRNRDENKAEKYERRSKPSRPSRPSSGSLPNRSNKRERPASKKNRDERQARPDRPSVKLKNKRGYKQSNDSNEGSRNEYRGTSFGPNPSGKKGKFGGKKSSFNRKRR